MSDSEEGFDDRFLWGSEGSFHLTWAVAQRAAEQRPGWFAVGEVCRTDAVPAGLAVTTEEGGHSIGEATRHARSPSAGAWRRSLC